MSGAEADSLATRIEPRQRLARVWCDGGEVDTDDVVRVCRGFVAKGSKLDGVLLLAALSRATDDAQRGNGSALLRFGLAALGAAARPQADQRAAFVRQRLEQALAGLDRLAVPVSTTDQALSALRALLVADRLLQSRHGRSAWRDWTLAVILPAAGGADCPRWAGLASDLGDAGVDAAVASGRQAELAPVILEHLRTRRLAPNRAARWLRRLWQTSKRPWRRMEPGTDEAAP